MSCAWTDVAVEIPASAAKAKANFFIVSSVFGLTFLQSMDVRRAGRLCPRPDLFEFNARVFEGAGAAVRGATRSRHAMPPAASRGAITQSDNASFPIAFPVAECATSLSGHGVLS
jgi:hypothetical protein